MIGLVIKVIRKGVPGKVKMSDTTIQEWRRQAASARPSAGRIRQLTDAGIVTYYVPRLAGRNVCLPGERVFFDTRREAVDAARRARAQIALDLLG